MKNFRDENGITLIKLIIIVFVIAALIGCYSFLTSNDNKVVDNLNQDDVSLEVTNEIDNTTKSTPPDDEMDIEITTFADASKYKIGDIITTGTITIGYIELPDIKIEYPIASKVTTDPALAYSPAYLYGPGINQVGRTIIVGMVDSFKDINKLKVGGKFILVDDEEIEKEYTITEIKETKSDDSSFGISKDKTKCEVALSLVYNDDEAKRLVIIAEEID